MNNISEIILRICGKNPEGVSYFDPGNDPNFVFQPDPNFVTLELFNSEGKVVNVNSWFECAHYVNGGWLDSQFIERFPGDKYIFYISVIMLAVYLSFSFFTKRSSN